MDALGKLWGRLRKPWGRARRSSLVVRRRSFVARLSPFVVQRWSLVGGHLGNSSFRNKACEDALASFNDTLEDEPSYPIERPRETSDPYGVSPETFHDCSLANVVLSLIHISEPTRPY